MSERYYGLEPISSPEEMERQWAEREDADDAHEARLTALAARFDAFDELHQEAARARIMRDVVLPAQRRLEKAADSAGQMYIIRNELNSMFAFSVGIDVLRAACVIGAQDGPDDGLPYFTHQASVLDRLAVIIRELEA